MLFALSIAACIVNAVISVVAFFRYLQLRTADRSEKEGAAAADHARRIAYLDHQERKWQRIHFITLSLFVFFGVIICVQLSNRLNGRPQT